MSTFSADSLPWMLAVASIVLLVGAGLWWALRQRRPEPAPLPTEWALLPRPVFSSDEKRVYRQLRDALPHHVVLSKLPLVRFCQPTDPERVRYWYELLGSTHVGFAICSAAGRVLAAIDLDTGRV
jgi:ABC-type nickel/cobalt efflux system permease component RcnA